jgi:hypothetical protein
MDFTVCTQCGVEIESKGIHFRGHVFCSDECCEEYEAEFADKDEPVIDELMEDDLESEEIEDNLGYRDGDESDSLDDDDEFDIKLEDF